LKFKDAGIFAVGEELNKSYGFAYVRQGCLTLHGAVKPGQSKSWLTDSQKGWREAKIAWWREVNGEELQLARETATNIRIAAVRAGFPRGRGPGQMP
jgi:hypothetical protein